MKLSYKHGVGATLAFLFSGVIGFGMGSLFWPFVALVVGMLLNAPIFVIGFFVVSIPLLWLVSRGFDPVVGYMLRPISERLSERFSQPDMPPQADTQFPRAFFFGLGSRFLCASVLWFRFFFRTLQVTS